MVLCLPYSIFFGTTPTYIIADMDLVKEITVKHFDKFTDRLVGGQYLMHCTMYIVPIVLVCM